MSKNTKTALQIATENVQAQAKQAGASVEVKAPAKTKKSKAPKNVAPSTLTLKNDGATDALKGRLSCRTSVIHAILVALYNEKGADATLNTKSITDAVNRQWARATEGGRPTSNAATASHMNTMKGRGYVEHGADGRGWRLSKLGAEVLSKGAPQS